MKKFTALFFITFFPCSLFAQLHQVWESPTTVGRKSVAFGYDGTRYFYIQDDLAGTIRFYNQANFQLAYTLEKVESEVFVSLIPDLNQNNHSEVLIQNWRAGKIKLRDLSTGEVLYQWEHSDSSYSLVTYYFANNVFDLLIQRTSTTTQQSSLLFYSTQTPTAILGE